jgi:hypothetical protein
LTANRRGHHNILCVYGIAPQNKRFLFPSHGGRITISLECDRTSRRLGRRRRPHSSSWRVRRAAPKKHKSERIILFLRTLCYSAGWSRGLGLQPVPRRAFRGTAPCFLSFPRKAGIQISATHGWMPAFAGMTGDRASLRRKAALSLSTGARFATGWIGFWVGIALATKTAK